MKPIFSALILFAFCPAFSENETDDSYNPNVEEVIVICKTHIDVGYTHSFKDAIRYYQTGMIDNALKVTDESQALPKEQQFSWTLPSWVLFKTLEDWPGQTPERKAKLQNAFKTGKIRTHALPFTMESDACEPECLVRGLNFASKLTREHGLPLPRAGKQTDVPSHGGFVATILANADVKFLHIGCNWPSSYIKTDDIPGLFWWEGPDGSRVLTLYSPFYGTARTEFSRWGGGGENLIPPKNWPHKTWPAILVTGDNVGPPSSGAVKKLFEDIAKKMPHVKVRMGSMDDFYEAIIKEDLKGVPVVKAEMPDSWVYGVMCDPEGSRISRETSPLLASSEALNTQLKIWGKDMPSITKDVASAYEELVLHGEHTWGGTKSINAYGEKFHNLPAESYASLEASWKDKFDHIQKASETARHISESNMLALAKSVKHDEPSIIVYNPLPWKRSGVATVDNENIFVEDVPPCGYRTYPAKNLKKQPVPIENNTLENDFFKIKLDAESCSIVSLVDKRTNREWVDHDSKHSLGQYLNERFTREQTERYATTYQKDRSKQLHRGLHKPGMISEQEVPYRAASPKNGKLSITGDGYTQKAVLSMPGDAEKHLPPSALKVTLYKNQPYIDLEITIQDKPKDNWPEADWLCLPFKISNPSFKVHRPLGRMDPAKDILPGACRDFYTVGNGVTITGPDHSGVAVCPLSHPLISFDTPGCWNFSQDFIPEKPVVYLNLYNNQWNTNFRYWFEGTWSSRVRIWTFDKNTANKDSFLDTHALEARNPLQAVVAEKNNGNLPARHSGLETSRKGVVVTAFGADPDGNDGILLRVWEQSGIGGPLTITLPESMKATTAIPVNLRGEHKGRPIAIKKGMLNLNLGAYAPASFIIK